MKKFYYIFILFFILLIIYSVFTQINTTTSKKIKRLQCQEKTITFENISNKNLLDKAVNLLETNNYKIKSRIEKSTYMESKILNYISVEKSDMLLNSIIKKYIKKSESFDKKLLIDYYILENDKEDKGKKSPKSKLYAGFLVFEFKLDNSLIYKIQTDYMKIDASDIPERMDCVIKSFISLKE